MNARSKNWHRRNREMTSVLISSWEQKGIDQGISQGISTRAKKISSPANSGGASGMVSDAVTDDWTGFRRSSWTI